MPDAADPPTAQAALAASGAPGLAERAAMGLAAAALALAIAGPAGGFGAPPYGEDAAFWGARAVTLSVGDLAGEHPPLYPALAALLHDVAGLPTLRTAQVLAFLAWVALPPAMATLGARFGSGRWAGWLTLGLPTLAAWSTRVEPTTSLALAGVLLALAMVPAARLQDGGRPARGPVEARAVRVPPDLAALLTGLGCGLLAGLKETGAVLGVGLILGAAVESAQAGRDWRRATGLRALGAGLAIAALIALIAPNLPPGESRLTMPSTQLWALLARGEPMGAMAAPDVPGWALPGPLKHAVGAPGVRPISRAAAFVAVQLLRTLAMAGPWALTPLLWRGARGPGRALAVGMLASGLPLLAVVYQSRHLEIPLLGAVLLASLALGRAAPWTRPVAIGMAMAWTTLRVATIEIPRAGFAVACATGQEAALDALPASLPAGAAVCTDEPWLHVRDDAPIPGCARTPEAWRLIAINLAHGTRERPPAPSGRGGARREPVKLGRNQCIGDIALVPPGASDEPPGGGPGPQGPP